MSDTSDIEKKSLEAHVELCAQRYRFLESRLEDVDGKISGLETLVREVHDMVQKMAEKRNDQLLKWGVGIITVLTGMLGYLLSHIFMT
jgi:hypothetical protein